MQIRTDTLVTRIICERRLATGVEIATGGSTTIVKAEREIIITCGAIGSPRLLMLSGIGAAAELNALDLPVIDSPGVDADLQDHIDIDVVSELTGPHSAFLGQI